jgi:hypothetical protein
MCTRPIVHGMNPQRENGLESTPSRGWASGEYGAAGKVLAEGLCDGTECVKVISTRNTSTRIIDDKQ